MYILVMRTTPFQPTISVSWEELDIFKILENETGQSCFSSMNGSEVLANGLVMSTSTRPEHGPETNSHTFWLPTIRPYADHAANRPTLSL